MKEVEEIVTEIESGRLSRSFKTHRDHVRHVKQLVLEKSQTDDALGETNLCPKCGHSMVQRIEKNGATQGQIFLGCSKYPKCKAIINID